MSCAWAANRASASSGHDWTRAWLVQSSGQALGTGIADGVRPGSRETRTSRAANRAALSEVFRFPSGSQNRRRRVDHPGRCDTRPPTPRQRRGAGSRLANPPGISWTRPVSDYRSRSQAPAWERTSSKLRLGETSGKLELPRRSFPSGSLGTRIRAESVCSQRYFAFFWNVWIPLPVGLTMLK